QSLPKMIYIVQDIRIVRNVVIAVLLYVYKLSLRADYLILSVSLSHFHHGSNHITWIPYDDNEFEIPELMRQLMKIIGKFRMLQDQDFRIVIFQRNHGKILPDVQPYQFPEISYIAKLLCMSHI